MSGGSWDYICHNIDHAADRLKHSRRANHRALGHLMGRVATAMHDIEWVDSGDYAPGDEDKAIAEALGKQGPPLVVKESIEELRELVVTLNEALDRAMVVTLNEALDRITTPGRKDPSTDVPPRAPTRSRARPTA